MQKILMLIGVLFITSGLQAQNCNSTPSSYDLTVFSYQVFPQNASMPYIQGYICSGATLVDSASCCTRMCHIDSGATLIVGPMSYGMAYVKSGGTFNGQGASNNWQVIAEPGANVIGHTGITQNCAVVTFPAAQCGLSVFEQYGAVTHAVQSEQQLMFHYSTILANPRVELFDITGKQVINVSSSQSDQQSVNVASLPSGIYLYRIYDGETFIGTDRVVITH